MRRGRHVVIAGLLALAVGYRASLSGTPLPTPAPQAACPATFGNTDIFGGSFADPSSP